jgi:uncharacterized membrane protein
MESRRRQRRPGSERVNGTSRIDRRVNQREGLAARIIAVVAAPLSLLLYAAVAMAWAGIALWLGRPLLARFFFTFLLLPVLFLLPAFVTTRTIFPVDHAMSLPPWSVLLYNSPCPIS